MSSVIKQKATSCQKTLFSGSAISSVCALISRILGLFREILCANLWGMSSVMDSFILALRIPNLFRRLLAEGVLSLGFTLFFSRTLYEDTQNKDKEISPVLTEKLMSSLVLVVFLISSVITLILEVICAGILIWADIPNHILLFLKLLMITFPCTVFICITSIYSGTFHALKRFFIPSLPPIMMNVVSLSLLIFLIPKYDPPTQATILAWGIFFTGVFQVLLFWMILRLGYGFHFNPDFSSTYGYIREIFLVTIPMMLGVMVIPINVFCDSVLAGILSASAEKLHLQSIPFFPGEIMYPLCNGAVTALNLGERMFQFPLGLLGIPVATAVFPLLSSASARNARDEVGRHLSTGLNLTLCLAIPASVGLVLVAEPLVRVFFQHGAFMAEDTVRTAKVVMAYGMGVVAFCVGPVLIRGFYALNDYLTPMRVGGYMVIMNLILNLICVWWLKEVGLALATTLVAGVHILWLIMYFHLYLTRLDLKKILHTLYASLLGSCVMYFICTQFLNHLLLYSGRWEQALALVFYIFTATCVYLGVYGFFLWLFHKK